MSGETSNSTALIAWGKRPRDGDEHAPFHPLCDHMLDVAACFLAIVQCTRIRHVLNRTAGRELSNVDLERLAVLAYLHDFGKANSGFQAKRWRSGAQGWPGHAGHVTEARQALRLDDELLAALPLDEMSKWGDSGFDLLLASLSHHGRPVGEPLGIDPRIWRPVVRVDGTEIYNPAAALKEIGVRALRVFHRAFNERGQSLPSDPMFVHLFCGLVQLADWLGSDTQFFPYNEAGIERHFDDILDNAKCAVRTIGLDAAHFRAAFEHSELSFKTAFKVPPYPIQSALGDTELGPLLILESETGSGKTEAALWRFAKLFKSGKVDSLYFALPTRVAAVQLYERVRRFVERVWPANAPVVVRALPGYESADGNDKIALPDYTVQWSDEPDDLKASGRWAAESPKRFLAATIAVGTIDQALLAALSVRHAHLRHALLSRSLLVVDEVHASDTYMSALLEQLLRAHVSKGGHALLLSATLGSSQRVRYRRIVCAIDDEPSVAKARNLPYPALTDGAHVTHPKASSFRKTVYWKTLNAIDDHEEVARLAIEAARQGARVLIVRNTVPSAIATQKKLEALIDKTGERAWLFDVDGVVTLHHSRFSKQDRPRLDARVQERFGKERERLHACIVVGTQTLEQSLDLDADLLITDICPMDVLLQRLGRLHRHDRPLIQRPEAYRLPHAHVLIPESGSFEACLTHPRNGLGRLRNGGGVYPDLRMIEATRRLIDEAPVREIPADNRKLVERATHPDCLRAIEEELGEAWSKLAQQLEGGKSAERVVARMHALDYSAPFADLTFPSDEERVATRLGAADRLARFDPSLSGPFGTQVHELTIRHHMLPEGLPLDAAPFDITHHEGGFAFSLGPARFSYGRFGIEKMTPEKT
jgi:CRISPR-associated endonuclease/helicase Cas3